MFDWDRFLLVGGFIWLVLGIATVDTLCIALGVGALLGFVCRQWRKRDPEAR